MTMTSPSIKCSRCSHAMDPAAFTGTTVARCPACRRELTVALFPALWQPPAAAAPETLIAAEEASCFYHEANRAAVVCDGCGRFLCKLCAIELRGQHLCPVCVAAGVRKKNVAALDHSRFLHGRIAVTLAVLPILAWPLTCLTAPAAVFTALRYWKQPAGLTGSGGHGNHIIALILGSAQIAVWLFVSAWLILKK